MMENIDVQMIASQPPPALANVLAPGVVVGHPMTSVELPADWLFAVARSDTAAHAVVMTREYGPVVYPYSLRTILQHSLHQFGPVLTEVRDVVKREQQRQDFALRRAPLAYSLGKYGMITGDADHFLVNVKYVDELISANDDGLVIRLLVAPDHACTVGLTHPGLGLHHFDQKVALMKLVAELQPAILILRHQDQLLTSNAMLKQANLIVRKAGLNPPELWVSGDGRSELAAAQGKLMQLFKQGMAATRDWERLAVADQVEEEVEKIFSRLR